MHETGKISVIVLVKYKFWMHKNLVYIFIINQSSLLHSF